MVYMVAKIFRVSCDGVVHGRGRGTVLGQEPSTGEKSIGDCFFGYHVGERGVGRVSGSLGRIVGQLVRVLSELGVLVSLGRSVHARHGISCWFCWFFEFLFGWFVCFQLFCSLAVW